MNTELKQSQKDKIATAIDLLKQAATLIDEVDNELYAEGSFPESPLGHTQWELNVLTVPYMQGWIDNGVEL